MRVSFVCIVLYSHLSPALLFFLILISGIFFFPISLENRPLKARYQRWLNLRKNFHFWSNSQKKESNHYPQLFFRMEPKVKILSDFKPPSKRTTLTTTKKFRGRKRHLLFEQYNNFSNFTHKKCLD